MARRSGAGPTARALQSLADHEAIRQYMSNAGTPFAVRSSRLPPSNASTPMLSSASEFLDFRFKRPDGSILGRTVGDKGVICSENVLLLCQCQCLR